MGDVSTAVQKQQGPEAKRNQLVDALVANMTPQLARALPKHVDSERFARIALTAIKSTPKLAECLDSAHGKLTLLGALMQSAQLGLEPGVLGSCWILPFRDKGLMTAQFILGYRGMIDLARRSGNIRTIYAHEVCANDDFQFSFGVGGTLTHRPCLVGERGPTIGYYSFAELTDGAYQYDFMTIADVHRIRDTYSKSSKNPSSPWQTEPDEMGKKTVLRRFFKALPVSVEMRYLSDVHDSGAVIMPTLRGDTIDLEYSPAVETHVALVEPTPDPEPVAAPVQAAPVQAKAAQPPAKVAPTPPVEAPEQADDLDDAFADDPVFQPMAATQQAPAADDWDGEAGVPDEMPSVFEHTGPKLGGSIPAKTLNALAAAGILTLDDVDFATGGLVGEYAIPVLVQLKGVGNDGAAAIVRFASACEDARENSELVAEAQQLHGEGNQAGVASVLKRMSPAESAVFRAWAEAQR